MPAARLEHVALRLGTQDATSFFHAGMIARRLGDRDEARRDLTRALAINPHFSILFAGAAQRTLTQLRG